MLMVLSLAATAQNKKIAILETVDKKGNVPYGVCLQLRGSLTYAISSTPGYEGYDRVDMAEIMDEHDFQRTGVVSDEQIRKLGVMTGCSSILVAEAAIYDAAHIIITAKILDVETASVTRSAPPIISSTKPEEMQRACEETANKLLAVEEIHLEVPPVQRLGLLTKGRDFYYLDGKRLTNEEYVELMKNCPEAWADYRRGCNRKTTGWILTITGVACAGTGFGLMFGNWYVGLPLMAGGAAMSLTSIPFFISGKHKKGNAYQVYNEYCSKPTATLSFGPATKGIGMGVYLNF